MTTTDMNGLPMELNGHRDGPDRRAPLPANELAGIAADAGIPLDDLLKIVEIGERFVALLGNFRSGVDAVRQRELATAEPLPTGAPPVAETPPTAVSREQIVRLLDKALELAEPFGDMPLSMVVADIMHRKDMVVQLIQSELAGSD